MKKNKNRIKLPIMRLMLGLMIILSSMIAPTEVKAADETREEHSQYITEEINVEPYRKKTNADGNYTIVPESIEGDDWIFAGWYTDSSCQKSLGKDVKTGTYTAKFVSADVLDVKAQISSNVLNENEEDDSTASLRFVTSVDSLKYSKVGFEVVFVEGEEPVTSASNKVYHKLYAVGSTKDVMSYKPSDIFCSMSQYFKACTITEIPTSAFGDAITATSFWITKDGTLVKGMTKSTTVNEGINTFKVYVSSTGDDNNVGTKTSPLKTLDKALEQVLSGGTIYVLDSFTADTDFVWEEHSKSVAIKGGTIDFSSISTLNIHDSVTFSSTSLTFADKAKIYAWGNRLKIDSSVTMDANNCLEIYGGGTTELTSDTELILLAGTYQYIYGGGDNANVIGNTSVTVGGSANTSDIIDYTEHNSSGTYTLFRLCGGGNQAAVIGNTSVTVGTKENAVNKFNYTFGGGYKGNVTGNCTFNFNGLAMSVCGGSIGANVTGNTYVKMEAGWVEQVFGGCDSGSVTGNADVQILGGEVVRRINGGSYNNDSSSTHHVAGHANVLIGPNATISLSYYYDNYISATSRYGYFEGECGTFIFNENSEYLTSNRLDDWNYCVKTNGNNSDDSYGNILPAGDCIQIIPKENYVATVTIGDEVKHYTEAESYYPLPELTSKDAQTNIIVTFSSIEDEQTDAQKTFIESAKAKIDSAYYETVEDVIAAAEHWDDAKITLLTEDNELVNIVDNSTGNGKIVTDKKNYVVGDTVVLSGVGNEGYYCSSITVDGETVELAADGTYTFTATKDTYAVEGSFQKKVFVDNTEWNLVKQNDGLVTLLESTTDGKYLKFHDKYETMDLKLTVKDNGRTDVFFKFENGEAVSFGVLNNNNDGNTYIVQTLNNGSSTLIDYNTRHYTLSADEISAYKGDGIEFRVVREGTKFYVFIEGHLISYEHATYPNNGIFNFDEKINADTKMNVTIRHYAWSGEEAAVEIPFSVSHELDKSFTEFVEYISVSDKYTTDDVVQDMIDDSKNKFVYQSNFHYADLSSAANNDSQAHARVLFDMAINGDSTPPVYRVGLYKNAEGCYLKADIYSDNSDSGFTARTVALTTEQIAKIESTAGLNIFFVQTGETAYTLFVEDGETNTATQVANSTYSYKGADSISRYRSGSQTGVYSTIVTNGYFYSSGYMTGEDVANALLASVTVTKNIAEGVTVTGLNDAYKIGDTVSFKADLEFGYLAKLVKVNGETLEANAEGKYEFDVTADHLNGLNVEIKSRRSADKSYNQFAQYTELNAGGIKIDDETMDVMKKDDGNRFIFQSSFKYPEISKQTNSASAYARVLLDIGGTPVYRTILYKNNDSCYFELDIYNDYSDSGFIKQTVPLTAEQVAKIECDGLNVFLVQTGESEYTLYLEDGLTDTVSKVEGSTYSYEGMTCITQYRSNSPVGGTPIIVTNGYFYGKGLNADEAANKLLAPISVEKIISEGVIVTGLNDTYQVGNKASFEVSVDFGYELDTIAINGNALETNTEGKYEFDVTAEYIDDLTIVVNATRSTDKTYAQFAKYVDLNASGITLDTDTQNLMKADDGNRFIFQSNFKYANLSAQTNSTSAYARVLLDMGGSPVYRTILYKNNGSCYFELDIYNDYTDSGFTKKTVSLTAEQVAKIEGDGLNVFFVQTGETEYTLYLEDGLTDTVSKVEGSTYTYAGMDHITKYRSNSPANGTPTIVTTGYFYGKGMDAEEAANTLLAPISVEKTISDKSTIIGLNDKYQVGDKVSFEISLENGYGVETVQLNDSKIEANTEGKYEFDVTTEHINNLVIEVYTTNKAFTQFAKYTELSSGGITTDTESQTLMKADDGVGFIYQSNFKYTELSTQSNNSSAYARVLLDMGGKPVYRTILYRNNDSCYFELDIYNDYTDSGFTKQTVPLTAEQVAKIEGDGLNVFFVQTGETEYTLYLEEGLTNTVSKVEGSTYSYAGMDHITKYRSNSPAGGTPTIVTTGYFYGKGFASGEEAVIALMELLQ